MPFNIDNTKVIEERIIDPCSNCTSTSWAAKNPLYCTCCEHEYATKHTKPVKVGH